MKVYVLTEWGDNVVGVVSTEARAKACRFIPDTKEARELEPNSHGIYFECIVDDEDLKFYEDN